MTHFKSNPSESLRHFIMFQLLVISPRRTGDPSKAHFVAIGVQHGETKGEVEFSTNDAPEIIEKTIRNELGLPESTRFRLVNAKGRGVAVSCNLPPGNYTVVPLNA